MNTAWSKANLGCLQIQPNKFPGHILQSSSRIFKLIKPPKYYNMGYEHMHFQLCTTLWIKLHKKRSN